MTITYPIVAPSVRRLTGITIRDATASASSRSPFSLKSQTQVFDGQMWALDVSLPLMSRENGGAAWEAFLLRLNGSEGTFLLGDPVGAVGRGVLTGTPVVNGGSQEGNVLAISGLTPDVEGWVLEGSWLNLGSGSTLRLYKVIEDADSDSSGEASLTIWPALRESPNHEDPVVFSNCVGRWRRPPGESSPGWSIEPPDFYAINFTAIEDI